MRKKREQKREQKAKKKKGDRKEADSNTETKKKEKKRKKKQKKKKRNDKQVKTEAKKGGKNKKGNTRTRSFPFFLLFFPFSFFCLLLFPFLSLFHSHLFCNVFPFSSPLCFLLFPVFIPMIVLSLCMVALFWINFAFLFVIFLDYIPFGNHPNGSLYRRHNPI